MNNENVSPFGKKDRSKEISIPLTLEAAEIYKNAWQWGVKAILASKAIIFYHKNMVLKSEEENGLIEQNMELNKELSDIKGVMGQMMYELQCIKKYIKPQE